MYVHSLCVCVFSACTGAHWDQKRVLDPLELEFPTVMSH